MAEHGGFGRVDLDDLARIFQIGVELARAIRLTFFRLAAQGKVLITSLVLGSMAVESLERPLKVKMCLVFGSKQTESGFPPVCGSPTLASVFRSKMVTLLDWPLVMNPLPNSGASAMPCTPCSCAI